MSHHINEQILERLFDEVSEMSTGSILRELEGGMKPGLCDSFDERVALMIETKLLKNLLIKDLKNYRRALNNGKHISINTHCYKHTCRN